MPHTPGPWKLVKTTTPGQFCWDYRIRAMDNSMICTVGPCDIDANSNLITAAPGLLSVLKMCHKKLCSMAEQEDIEAGLIAVEAGKIITKAEKG